MGAVYVRLWDCETLRLWDVEVGEWRLYKIGGDLYCISLFNSFIIKLMAEMKIRDHKDLEVYQIAFECAMEIFEISKNFPKEEIYSLTDQI